MHDSTNNILTPHQTAALNYKNHISLTANAGSGKTFVLSRRYLEIALNENIPLRNIAAITFTDKAAGELYRKIANEVEKMLIYIPDETVRGKLEKIRRQLVSANISTIHSFCIDILREYPVEASLDANFNAIDEPLSNELVELSVEETIKSAFDNPEDSNDIKYLIRIFASKRIFAEELFSLIKNRKNVFEIAETIYSKSENEIAEHFHYTFNQLFEKIFINRKDSLYNFINKINNLVLNISPNNKNALSAAALLEELKTIISSGEYLPKFERLTDLICTKSNTIKIKDYLPKEIQQRFPQEIDFILKSLKIIKSLCISENHIEVEKELALFGQKVIKFFNKAVELYEEKKKEKSYLDFEDILLNTRKVLKNKSVRQTLSGKYKFIMVDEYQDTNEIQYQIFLPILNDLKAGNFFVVGDEKQSIYMFRDAELEVFSETKRNIENTSGKNYLLTLPDSFRMAPEICLFTNSVFKSLFDEPNEYFNEVEYSELVCARNNAKGKVEFLIGSEDENSMNTEPELVAKKILQIVNRENIKWDEIALLVRKRKNFLPLEKVFSKYKIPFSVVGGTGFYQKQSVYDIYSYFSFLLDKNNDTALVGILRSPFFNLSDAQVFEISREQGFGLWNKFKNYCRVYTENLKICNLLEENLMLVKNYEPAILLRKILNETNYLSVLASKPNGGQELANLEKLINLTTAFNQQSFRTVYDYLNYLKESIEKTEDESQASVAEESDSVKIMTLHQAKGLEYKAVFLFRCDEISVMNSVQAKKIAAVKKAGLITKVPVNENYFSEYEAAPIANIYNYIIRKKEIAEIKRLLYVGITRAMDYLFISASAKKDYKYNDASFIGLLSKALNLNFDNNDYRISAGLKLLKKKDNGYETLEEKFNLTIPLTKELEDYNNAENLNEKVYIPDKLRTEEIIDQPEGEIISATKLSIFSQCQLKYKLTYEYGFTKLMEKFKDWNSVNKYQRHDFNPYEDEKTNNDENPAHTFGDVKGRIIHKVLQKEIDKLDLKEAVSEMIKDEMAGSEEIFSLADFENDILADLNKYYDSSVYSEISKLKNYKNEFEIYSKEVNYFLFGIIDKIAFADNKAVIIDFKTDDINKDEILQRFESYLTQLKFYSYIVSRLYKNIEVFELKIIFIKHPDEKTGILINRNKLVEIKNSINEMVHKTRTGMYNKNLLHCPNCIFSINQNRCIIN